MDMEARISELENELGGAFAALCATRAALVAIVREMEATSPGLADRIARSLINEASDLARTVETPQPERDALAIEALGTALLRLAAQSPRRRPE